MEIIELNELQFKNYSNIHSKKNYKQSIEYANLEEKNGYNKLFLGLVDDNQNVIAATLLLEKKLSGKYKYGYCPNGFLIDFFNSKFSALIFSKPLCKNFTPPSIFSFKLLSSLIASPFIISF